jgi:hypothetical protein
MPFKIIKVYVKHQPQYASLLSSVGVRVEYLQSLGLYLDKHHKGIDCKFWGQSLALGLLAGGLGWHGAKAFLHLLWRGTCCIL